MARKKATKRLNEIVKAPKKNPDALAELAALMSDPFSEESDQILNSMVERYKEVGRKSLLIKGGLLFDRKWPMWVRISHIYFINMVCNEKKEFKKAVSKVLKSRNIDLALRETLRCFFVEAKGWNTKKNGLPKQALEYWNEAMAALKADVDLWRSEGKVFDETTTKPFKLLGKDFSPSTVEWLAVSDD